MPIINSKQIHLKNHRKLDAMKRMQRKTTVDQHPSHNQDTCASIGTAIHPIHISCKLSARKHNLLETSDVFQFKSRFVSLGMVIDSIR